MVWPAIIAGAAALAGGALGNENNRKLAHEQMDMQREFAQQGIRWKVADAKAAGLHPLYALGASTSMPSAVHIQDQLGPALANAGQDISRAMLASQEREDREAAAKAAAVAQAAALEGTRLNNLLTEERIRRERQGLIRDQLENGAFQQFLASYQRRLNQQLGPPGPGQSGSPTGDIKYKPDEVTSADRGARGRTAGAHPGMRTYRFGGNRFGFDVDLPVGDELSDSLEGMGEVVGGAAGLGLTLGHWGSLGLEKAANWWERKMRETREYNRARGYGR